MTPPAREIFFITPPSSRTVGGLDTAIKGWVAALETKGARVHLFDSSTLPPRNLPAGATLHVHGLWESNHRHWLSSGLPYLFSPHGMLEPWAYRHKWWKKAPYFHLIEKSRLQKSAAVLATSPLEAANLRRMLPKARIETLPLGLPDAPEFSLNNRTEARKQLGIAVQKTELLYLSRVDPKKGLFELIQALARPEIRADSFRLRVVGTGDPAYREKIRVFSMRHQNDLPEIIWEGAAWGADRWKYFHAADLFCLPTHSENFGLAALEAFAAGVPVLTGKNTPWPGYGPPEPFFSCDPDPEQIARHLLSAESQLPADDSNRMKRAHWARSHFSWDQIAKDYLALLDRVMPL